MSDIDTYGIVFIKPFGEPAFIRFGERRVLMVRLRIVNPFAEPQFSPVMTTFTIPIIIRLMKVPFLNVRIVHDEALDRYGEPEFFNSDQGSQFTSPKFLDRFSGRSTRNSMDGRGRWLDNVYMERFWWTAKYECMHLQGFATLSALRAGLEQFMNWYNDERLHSSLGYRVPSAVYSGEVLLPREHVSVRQM